MYFMLFYLAVMAVGCYSFFYIFLKNVWNKNYYTEESFYTKPIWSVFYSSVFFIWSCGIMVFQWIANPSYRKVVRVRVAAVPPRAEKYNLF